MRLKNSQEPNIGIPQNTNKNSSQNENSISPEEELNTATKINIQTAYLWTNSQGMESIKIICHPNTESISI